MYNQPLFASRQTSARIDFLRQGGLLVDEKGTFCVKFLVENWTKVVVPCKRAWATEQGTSVLATPRRKRLQGMQSTANAGGVVQMQQ